MSSNPPPDSQSSSRGQLRLSFGTMPPPPPQRSREPLFERICPAKRVPPAFFYPDKEITMDMIERDGQFKSPESLRLAYKVLSEAYEADARKNGRYRVRDDGSDYMQHALRVAYRIAIVGKGRREDEEQVIAGVLHDVPEDDFGIRLEEIEKMFGQQSGPNIAEMIYWLTKPKWDGREWVYPDSAKYYEMEDLYDHSMYDSRGKSYYDRLYFLSGSPSAWVLKAADNLDNLYTLANVEPAKRQRNARLIVNNTFAVLSRMLAREDIEQLVWFMEEGLKFEVPRDTIAKYADSWVVSCDPRTILVRQGLRGVAAPRDGQINVYGLHPAYLLPLDFFEIGLPGNGHDFLPLLEKEFPEYEIKRQESYLPPRLAASESMFRFRGFRNPEALGSYVFIPDEQTLRIRVWRDKTPHMTLDLASLPNMRFDEPQLRDLYMELERKCADILHRLEEFQKVHMQPKADAE